LIAGSSSTIVSVAVRRAPSTAPPVGLRKLRLTVSSPSPIVSSRIGMVNVETIWPEAKVSVPEAAV